MINKRLFLAGLTTGLLSLSAAFPAMAGSWKTGVGENAARWWYDNGDNTWAANGWRWIDGNQDGISECYYFDADGWLTASTTTPDGYTVNADGAWTVNGIIQTRQTASNDTADNESWDDFQNSTSHASKKAKKKATSSLATPDSDSSDSNTSSSEDSSSDDTGSSNKTSGSHSNSGSSGPSKEASSTSGDKKPDAPKKNSKQEPDSGYRQGSVTDEEIENNSSSDSDGN